MNLMNCNSCLLLFVLNLDLYFHTAGELKFHQGIDCLGSGAVDVDQALVGAELELLAGLLVDECTTVHCVDALSLIHI